MAVVLLVALTVPLRAQDSDAGKPIGTWTHTATMDDHQVKVKLEVKADTIHCVVRTTEGPAVSTLTVDADYIVSRDGLLVGVLPAPRKSDRGDTKDQDRLFLCRFTVEKNTLVVTEVNSGGSDDQLKKVFEGKYHRVSDKVGAVKKEAPKAERVPYYQSSSY
jgi:hypothetical protein